MNFKVVKIKKFKFLQKIMNVIALKILEFIYGEMMMSISALDVDLLDKMDLVVIHTMINFQLNVFQEVNGLQEILVQVHIQIILI